MPIIVLALVAGKFLVPKSRDPEESQFDPLGAVLSIVGVVALVYGLIEAPDKGWMSVGTIAAFAVAVVVLALFVAWELHTPEPMLDMHYFRRPAFSTGTGGMILVFVAMYGVMFLITQYFQLVLGYSALSAALRLMPIAMIMIVVAPLTPRLSARFGAHRTVVFGMLCIATGLLLFTGLTTHTAVRVRRAVRRSAHHRHRTVDVTDDRVDHVGRATAARGAGSAMNDATRELGAALGIAVLGQRRRVALRELGRARAARPQPGRPGERADVDRRRAARRVDAADGGRRRARVERVAMRSSTASTSQWSSARRWPSSAR